MTFNFSDAWILSFKGNEVQTRGIEAIAVVKYDLIWFPELIKKSRLYCTS